MTWSVHEERRHPPVRSPKLEQTARNGKEPAKPFPAGGNWTTRKRNTLPTGEWARRKMVYWEGTSSRGGTNWKKRAPAALSLRMVAKEGSEKRDQKQDQGSGGLKKGECLEENSQKALRPEFRSCTS